MERTQLGDLSLNTAKFIIFKLLPMVRIITIVGLSLHTMIPILQVFLTIKRINGIKENFQKNIV